MTRAEAIRQVLEDLGVIDSITEPAAEDAALVGRRLDQVRDELSERGACWWDADAIPAAAVGPFTALVAEAASAAFGKSFSAPTALARLSALKSGAARPVLKTEYL